VQPFVGFKLLNLGALVFIVLPYCPWPTTRCCVDESVSEKASIARTALEILKLLFFPT
jgi:hypothetical protein